MVVAIVNEDSFKADHDPDPRILDPDRDPDRHQNLTDSFLGHAPHLQKFHQNQFITCVT